MTTKPRIPYTKPSITDLEICYSADVQVKEWNQGYDVFPSNLQSKVFAGICLDETGACFRFSHTQKLEVLH